MVTEISYTFQKEKILIVDAVIPPAPSDFISCCSTEVHNEPGKVIDILPMRKLPWFTNYFLGCTNPEEVNFLVIDMNAAYFELTNRVLQNAKVVIDRSHNAKYMNQVLNELHVRKMNDLRKAGGTKARLKNRKLPGTFC